MKKKTAAAIFAILIAAAAVMMGVASANANEDVKSLTNERIETAASGKLAAAKNRETLLYFLSKMCYMTNGH